MQAVGCATLIEMSASVPAQKEKQPTAIVWFRKDLRLADNPALCAAIASGAAVLPVYILDPEESLHWPMGGASLWWLHHSLAQLQTSLAERGLRLVLRKGTAKEVLFALANEVNLQHVFWNRQYEPECIARDKQIKTALQECGIAAESFNGSLLFEPWEIRTGEGNPYKVFTPYSRACLAAPPPEKPQPDVKVVPSPKGWPQSLPLDSLELLPKLNWADRLQETWMPGEIGAWKHLRAFRLKKLSGYPEHRDYPAEVSTSRLSPHLHFGEISARQVWNELQGQQDAAPYLRQILWREFAHHMLYYFPTTPTDPFRAEFRKFPWKMDAARLKAWTRGETGYPLVDAGMRELWHTGWMHNRVRMVVASFLVKHLLLPWQEGALWFWDTLVDADLANNTFGWQWAAGCGADAAPYFRIFNPILQSRKFDAAGEYIRRWVPELRALDNNAIHAPWLATVIALKGAGVTLGKHYPRPIVDHATARAAALAAFASLREK